MREDRERSNIGSLLLKIVIAVVAVLLIVFLLITVFPTKSALNPLYQEIFRNNLDSMRTSAEKYFTNERLPQEIDETIKMTLQEMLDKNLLLAFTDKNGKACDITKSYVEMTRKETEYEMKVKLSCDGKEAFIIDHLGCNDKCIALGTCNATKKEYEFQRQVEKQELERYSCPSGYTLSGSLCVKNVTKTSTIDAIKLYKDKLVQKDPTITKTTENVYNYLYTKTETYYEDVPNKDMPIIQKTYDNIIGYKTVTACTGYKYFVDSTTSKIYQGGELTYVGTQSMTYVPNDDVNYHYEVIGMDFDHCSNCTKQPVYLVKVYKRTANVVEVKSNGELNVTCASTESKSIPIYGLKMTFVGYVTDRVEKERTVEKWSASKNDQTLISQGYKYTETSKVVDTIEKTKTTCDSGYTYNESNKKCEKKEKVFEKYSCETGYTLSGSVCKKTYTTVEKINATKHYRKVYILEYKWSESKTLEGWTATGRTRTVQVEK